MRSRLVKNPVGARLLGMLLALPLALLPALTSPALAAAAPQRFSVRGAGYGHGIGLRLHGVAVNGVRSGLYRGSLEIRVAVGPHLNAINTVGMESYLQGVVPAESPPIWPAAALQAQAVAARSYALATQVAGRQFDQYADTRSQMYKGISAETPTTTAAVAATRGEVV